jgi:hypothetical protein
MVRGRGADMVAASPAKPGHDAYMKKGRRHNRHRPGCNVGLLRGAAPGKAVGEAIGQAV